MLHLPARFAAIILAFAPLFRHRTWRHAEVLLIGAILAPGKRTVTSLLRITGLSRERRFANYHRVLNRARWSGPRGGPPAAGPADRRLRPGRSGRARPRRHHRAPPRQAHQRQGHLPRSGALVRGSLRQGQRPALAQPDAAGPDPLGGAHLGAAVPDRPGALRALLPRARTAAQEADRLGAADGAAGPPLAARARAGAGGRQRLRRPGVPGGAVPPRRDLHHPPAARCGPLRAGPAAPARDGRPAAHQGRSPAEPGRRAERTSTRWRRVTVPGWYGEGDRVVEICSATAVWRHGGMPVVPIRWVLLRDPLGRFDPQALLCTDPARDPLQIVRWFVQRWQVEVTFQEVRDHLGVETQRQWSDRAIARTTPCLLGLFSIVTLLAATSISAPARLFSIDSWYRKPHPTFADTLAAVRRQIWRETGLLTSRHRHKTPKPSRALQRCLVYALCHAA